MREMPPGDLLRELIAIEGRYIQWEWEPETLANDYITLREATGYLVMQRDKSGKERSVYVSRAAIQRLITDRSVYEDEFKRASGFRIYRPTNEGRSRCDLPRTSAAT
jgi:integrase